MQLSGLPVWEGGLIVVVRLPGVGGGGGGALIRPPLLPPVLCAEPGHQPSCPLTSPHNRARKIPIIIRRYLPDGSYEDWGVDELIITD